MTTTQLNTQHIHKVKTINFQKGTTLGKKFNGKRDHLWP